MSITVIKEGNILRMLECSDPIPEGAHLRLYTEDEVRQLRESDLWAQIPASTRNTMGLQAQAKSYQSWMEEDDGNLLRWSLFSWKVTRTGGTA